MWDQYRLTSIAIYVGPVPVNGYRNICGGRYRFAAIEIYVGADTGLRLSQSMWDRYRFTSIAIYVAACDFIFWVVQNKFIVFQIRCHTYFYLCSLLIVSSDYPI
jgi:hypothetical protein